MRTELKTDREFLEGFLETTGLKSLMEAQEQWGAWSRQLSDHEIARCMRGGYHSGRHEGFQYSKYYPRD